MRIVKCLGNISTYLYKKTSEGLKIENNMENKAKNARKKEKEALFEFKAQMYQSDNESLA